MLSAKKRLNQTKKKPRREIASVFCRRNLFRIGIFLVLLLFLAVVVGTIVVAMFLPMIKIISAVSGGA